MSLPASSIGEYAQVVGFGLHDSRLLGLVYEGETGRLVIRLGCRSIAAARNRLIPHTSMNFSA